MVLALLRHYWSIFHHDIYSELFKSILDHKYNFYLLNYKVYEELASLFLIKMCNSHDKDSSYRILDAFVKFKLCKNLQLWNVGFYNDLGLQLWTNFFILACGKKTANFVRSVLVFAINSLLLKSMDHKSV